VVCIGVQGDTHCLWPEEFSAVSNATLKRQREYAAGRTAAREAMRRIAQIEAPVLSNRDRSPRWPHGIVGSIAHTADTCLVVAGLLHEWKSIGIDIEPMSGIDESLWSIICTPEELERVRREPSSGRSLHVTRLFVAKEAFYKWHYPQSGRLFDFQEVSIHWGSHHLDFTVSARDSIRLEGMDALKGRMFTLENHLVAFCAK